ncbi:MAG: efflux RND transporter permease subunit [Methyloceanibacter sp.]|uniref:efflux RND transporter permease subunit n=1 Tax=Methyloceanibacter sp. TaxID=1965321 RepID=UPI003C42E04F
MNAIIDAAFERTRTIVLAFVMIVVLGAIAYTTIPKEAEPDIQIPIIYVSMTYEGISPEDSERLLVRPMEKELQSIEGIKEMRSVAAEGYGSITLEFDAGFDSNKALEDVREKVDIARAELPLETDEPRVNEVNIALFPVITIGLSGNVPERTLVRIARDLRDKIEGLAGVLDVDIGGDREELLEIVVDPMVLETYNISFADISNTVARNNRLVAAGALESVAGRLVLKVPGVLEEVQDIFNLPVKVVDNTVVKFSDVASIRRTFKDPQGFARVGGNPALALEVKKRLGANIVETIQDVRAVVAEEKIAWPPGIEVSYMQDKSKQIRNMLADLQNNVFAAIALVMIVIVAAIGVRPAILVGLAIPGSFLAGILFISWIGLTLNIVVLFSLILVVGMLVDGAIVTTELADRKMLEGKDRKQAYAEAAKRMAWPIIASTATTLAVFLPLIFWPGIVGEFMKFLPVTVLATLAASLAMALIFIPVLGGIIGYADKNNSQLLKAVHAAEDGDLEKIGGAAGIYLKTLKGLLAHPAKVLGVAVTLLIGTYIAFGAFGRGVEFFPDVDQDIGQVQVRARGDLSVTEMDAIVRTVEARLLGVPYFDAVYARTVGSGAGPSQREMAEDVIGIVQFELKNWRTRPPASEVLKEVRTRTANIPGVILEVRKQKAGPSAGKPLEILVTSRDPKEMSGVVERIRSQMDQIGGFVDAVDSRPLPGIEWRVRVDRERAARHGADVSVVGQVVSMLTNGLFVAEYRPDDADEEVEIRLRMPLEKRNLEQLNRLRVATPKGQVPIGNFVRFEPSQKTSQLKRTDGRRVLEIKADVTDGLLVDEQVRKLKAAVSNMDIDPSVNVRFKGQDADQREASNFLIMAFFIAIFSMVAILVTQFNSFYQTALVLSAIVFSTAGVMIGLLATNQPFGIVMCGIGIIALAGIVVNNNIVLIDTYNDLRSRGMPAEEAVLRTAAQRVRPVLLTSITTVLGLLPMVFAISIDIIGQDVSIGAPSTQWWTQLSSSIAGGLAFATVLTLLLTPCLLMLGDNISVWWHGRAGRRAKRQSRAGRPQAAE